MPIPALSIGREVDLRRPRTGVVHSTFKRAINLAMDVELWTVLDSDQADLPYGIRLAPCTPAFQSGIRVGTPVHARAGYLGLGSLVIDARSAARWSPAPWGHPSAGLESRIAFVRSAACGRAWSESEAMARDIALALGKDARALASAVGRTLGRGPGLTPAGDDVLVGMLAPLTSGAVGAATARAAARLVAAIAPALPFTNDISRHLLAQAARGLPGRALQELAVALVGGGPGPALRQALAPVLATGSTSGADACLGLTAACLISFSNTERAAA